MKSWRWHWRLAAGLLVSLAIVALAGCLAPSDEQTTEQQQVDERSTAREPVETPRQRQSQPEPAAVEADDDWIDELLAELNVAAESDQGVDYDRDLYGRWAELADSGCSVRERVLIAEAKRITQVDERCRPLDGVWLSWFDGVRLENPSDVHIDHMVPLAEAHRSGAARWGAERRWDYYNDLDLPAALTAVSASSNQTKSDQDPSKWRPSRREAWCQYARDWVAVKVKWSLSADRAELEALRQMLTTCTGDYTRPTEFPQRRPSVVDAEVESQTPPPSSPTPGVYASCDEAAASGLERRTGRSGSGRGFPAASVPSARDGDGDGVVCER